MALVLTMSKTALTGMFGCGSTWGKLECVHVPPRLSKRSNYLISSDEYSTGNQRLTSHVMLIMMVIFSRSSTVVGDCVTLQK